MRAKIAAMLFCMAGAFSAMAQTGVISGRVDDASGTPVNAAMVQLKSLETGASRTLTTDADGVFRFLEVPLGEQEIRAEKTGFKIAVRRGVNLAQGQEAVVNVRLEVGELAQQIVVTEEAPLVNTTTASVAGMVGERQLKELPLNGRSFDNLITLNPGAINYSAMKSPGTSTSNGNTFSVAGRRTGENLFLMNGIEYTGSSQLAITPGGTSGQLLGIDAIREFNVLTDTYTAEYGKRAGAQVSVVTQSGSNVLHGSVFEFLRNNALDARNFFDQGKAPAFRRNQFGGSLGGPIKRDKAFIFGNYEGFQQVLLVSNVSVVPDAQARLGNLPNAQGVYAPVANLNRNMLQYMQMWPAPNGPALLANGVPTGTALSYNNPRQRIKENFGTMRADYNISGKDTLSAAWTVDDGSILLPQAGPLFGSFETLRNQVASLRETHVFSGGTVNTVNIGFSRAAFNYDSAPYVQFPSSLSFVAGLGPGGIVVGGGATTTGVAAITSVGPNNAAGVWNRRNLFTYTDNLNIIRGRHQIGAGVWFQRMQDNENSASRTFGQASFASLTTFLQGTLTSFQVVPNPNPLGWRSLFGAWHVEDTFRVRPGFTVQVGLRHEFTNGFNEVSGRAANYITDNNGILITAPRVGNSAFTTNNAKKLFGARVGLAWDVRGDGKTAVRAGFGTYYSIIDDLSFLLNSLPPWNGSVSLTGSLPNLLPIQRGVPPPPSCGPGVPAPCTTYAPQGVQADARTPAVQQWSFTLEQQLDRSTAVRATYIGSFGVHGFLSTDPNTIPAQVCQTATCVTGGTGAARGSVTQGQQYIPVAATRPNPYLGAGFFWLTNGNTSYQGLRTEVIRRLTGGLEARLNYTFSKSLDNNSGLTGAQANNQAQMIMDRNDPKRDWGPSALNVRHQSSLSARYELPFGAGKRFAFDGNRTAQALFGGWQMNTIITMLSGFPVTPQVGSNRSGDGNTRNPDRPSFNPAFTGELMTRKQTQWYNPNAFALPTVGTWGNAGRGILTGPGLATVDFSVFKGIRVREGLNLQMRAEIFNLLNHTNFSTPNAIVFSGGAISPSAGLITSTATTPRQIQLGMKLVF